MTPISLSYVSRTIAGSFVAMGNGDNQVAWSPRERAWYAFTLDGPNAALVRISDAVSFVGGGWADLGLPAMVRPLALFAGAEGPLRLVTLAHNEPARVHRLEGTRFVPDEVAPFPASVVDGFAWDPKGERLHHVALETGQVRALAGRELVDVGALDLQAAGGKLQSLRAVWDRARDALVVLAVAGARGPVTLIYKDGATSVIEGVPGVGRGGGGPFKDRVLVTHPRTGRSLLLVKPADVWPSHGKAAPTHVLGDAAWEEIAGDPTPNASAYATGEGELLALTPGRVPLPSAGHVSNVAVRREYALYDGETWTLRGRVLPLCQRLVITPEGPRALLGGEVVARLADGEVVPEPPIAGLKDILATPTGLLHLGTEQTPVPAPEAALVGSSGLGAPLAIGGKDPQERGTQVTRAFQGGAWTELKTRGKPHKQYAALAVHDATRGLVVLAGGFSKDRFVAQTSEFDGKAWTTYDGEVPWTSVSEAKLLAHDPTSGHVFAAVATPSGWDRKDERFGLDLFRYEGAGQWTRAGELRFATPGSGGFQTVSGGFAVAYDPSARALLCAGPVDDGSGAGGVLRAELGALLDAWPRAGASAGTSAAAAEAPAQRVPRRALVMKEDGASKFWIAELADTQWTARWGKRGSEGQSKTSSFDSAEKAAKDFDKKVREKLDKGYRDVAEGEDPSKLAGREGWSMKFGRWKPGSDQIHGAPPLDASRWPTCRACRRPLETLAVLHRHAERLPLTHTAAIAVFQCGETECEPWDPARGGNRVLLLGESDLAAEPPKPPAGCEHARPQSIAYGKPRFELDPEKEEVEEQPDGNSKLGGFPGWVQHPEVPTCDACAKPMRFVAQLAGNEAGMNFGDVGVGYLFICPEEHQGKFLSQSA